MPQIIPIRDLKNTSAISQLCRESGEPVFITKNGYGDMVIMSLDTYHKTMLLGEVYAKLAEAEAQVSEGRTLDATESIATLRSKYGL